MAKDLYSTKDVAEVRKLLLTEQDGCDKLTGLPIPEGQAVCDHDHITQFVRGILHRQVNTALGKLEGIQTRYLGYWYPGTLPQFLRQAAYYLETKHPQEYVHPAWIKRLSIDYGKLSTDKQKQVLCDMKIEAKSNATARREAFTKGLKSKQYTFEQIKELMK